MNNLVHHAKRLVLLAAGLSFANVIMAQTQQWNVSSGNWSSGGNWSPNGVPGTITSVLLTNNVGAATSAGTIDNIVDPGFGGPIASLQYANTNTSNGSGFYHTTQIASGQTLTVTNGLTVGTLNDANANCVVNATITGPGAKLVVSGGVVVNQASANGGAHVGILNMTNLDTFVVNGGRLQIGVANGVNRAEGNLYLAKTNIITLSGSAPQLYMGFNNGNNNGSTTFPVLYLGQSNYFAVDSITISADKQGNPASRMFFNPIFTNNNPAAVFRGASGGSSRVSSWILGNNGGQTTTSSISDGTNDFTFGILDAMVNTMTLGISEKGAGATTGNGNGTFTFTAGTNNINNLIIGQRICTAGSSVGNGTMNVNGTANLIVNNGICLAQWATGGNSAFGTANLNINGGTVMAGTITNGVTAPGSVGVVNANITMSGGTLGISTLLGSIGTSAWPLGIVTLNNATLNLPVSGVQTNLVTTILGLSGTSNTVNITSIPATVISYPFQYALMSYAPPLTGSYNVTLGSLPGTYQGYISNNVSANTIDLVLTNGPTSLSVLEWKGQTSSSWDTTSLNWLNGATPVAYSEGTSVLFDDNATGPTSINLTAVRQPANVVVSNSVLPYAFSGAGIGGGSSVTKWGAGTLLFTNSGNTFIGNLAINAGSVQFGNGGTSGNLPAVNNVIDNGNLIFNHSSNDTLPNSLSGSGTLTKNANNVLAITASNSFSGATIVNSGTLVVDGVMSGTLANAAGSTVGGAGTNTGTVTVGGAIQPSAASATPATFTSGDLNLLSGGTLTFDLNGPDTTTGNGINDLIMAGNLSANNNTIALSFAGLPNLGSPYTLINFSGGFTGSFNPVVAGTHYTAALNQSTPNQISVTLSGTGANLTWDCATNNGLWDNGLSTNWINTGSSSLDVFYAGDSVLFDDTAVATNLTIGAGVTVSPILTVFNSNTKNFTVNGSGQIGGAGTLIKQGNSTLVMNTPNHSFTGTALIQGGVFQAGNNASLVGATTTVTNGATEDIHGFAYINGPQTVTISGNGSAGQGALINNGADEQNAFQNIALAADASVGGPGRMDMRQSGSNPLTLNSANGNPYQLTILGPGHFNLVSVQVDGNLGNVDIKGGTFGLQVNTLINSGGWAGDSSKSITIETDAQLSFFNLTTSTPLNRTVIMSNGATMYNESGLNQVGGSVVLNGNDTFQVDNAGPTPTLIISGIISGSGNLIKTGVSPLALNGANTYTGSTLITGGTVTLSDSSSIATSPLINLSAGTAVDASTRTDTALNLASGQTLQGNGAVFGILSAGAGSIVAPGADASTIGILTVTNTVSLGGTTVMKLNAGTDSSDQLVATNGIAYGGTLVVTNLSGTFTNGETFHLFSSTTYTSAFGSLVLPSTPGLTWTNNLAVNGTLTVGVTGPPPQPHITSISLVGTNIVINGTNGVNGEQYHLLTTTNLTLPVTSWTVFPASTLNGASFSITNGVTPGAAQSFYILRVP